MPPHVSVFRYWEESMCCQTEKAPRGFVANSVLPQTAE